MAKERTIVYRTTVVTGRFQATAGVAGTPPPPAFPPLELGVPEFTVTYCQIFTVRAFVDWSGNAASMDFDFNLTLTCAAPFNGFNAQDDFTYNLLPGGNINLNLENDEITFTMQVEEVAYNLPEADFPSTFGPAVAHGPKKTTAVKRERVKAGTNIEIAASVGGAALLVSIPITTSNQFYLDDVARGEYAASHSALATALPTATTVTLSTQVEFGALTPQNLSCPLTGDDHGHSVSGDSVSAVAPEGTYNPTLLTVNDGHRTFAGTTIHPLKSWAFFPYFRAMEDAYPFNVSLRIDKYAGAGLNILQSVVGNGTEAASYEQKRYSGSGRFEDISASVPLAMGYQYSSYSTINWSLAGTQPTSIDLNEWADFQCGIDSDWLLDNNEETEDWRCFVQSELPVDVGGLTHDSQYVVDDGTNTTWAALANVAVSNAGGYLVLAVVGGTGSASRTFNFPTHEQNPKMDWQAGTDLVIVIQADAATKPFTVTVNGKTWDGETGATPNSDSTVTLDLRAPHNATAATDATQSRWPIGTEGPYFGVNAAAAITLSGLEDGVTYRVNSIALARRGSSRVTFGLPTHPWLPSGGGSDYLRHVFGESFKVALEVPGMYLTVSPSGIVYNWISVQQFFDTVAARPGWTGTNTATPEQLSKQAMWLNGIHGACWNGAAWANGVDMDADAGADLILAEGADIVHWYPSMGEPGGAYAEETPMRVGKVLRGRIGAVVIDPVAHEGAVGVAVLFTGGASPNESVDTDAEGYARSEGRKFGTGSAQVGESSVSVSVYNRWIAWSGFSEPGTEVRNGLTLDFSAGIRFVRGYNQDGTIRLAFATDAGWFSLIETDTGIAGYIREARWQRMSSAMRLFVTYTDTNDLLWIFTTLDEGNSVEMSTQLSTEIVTQATNDIGINEVIYSYWRTDSGAIKGKMLNFAGDLLEPRPEEAGLLADGFTVVASAVENVDIACSVSPGGNGQFFIILDYYTASGLTQIVSTDGRNFT